MDSDRICLSPPGHEDIQGILSTSGLQTTDDSRPLRIATYRTIVGCPEEVSHLT